MATKKQTVRSGNIEYDRWWLRHFAQVIFDAGYFDEKQYKEMLNMIERELSRMYRKAALFICHCEELTDGQRRGNLNRRKILP